MKDASKEIRNWLYTSLNGKVIYGSTTVPVYTIPDKDIALPYIIIGEISSPGEDGCKDRYITDYDITLEIWTDFAGNIASYVPADSIASSVLQLLRTMAATSGYSRDEGPVAINSAFNVIRVNMRGMVSDVLQNETKLVVYKSVNINLLVEEV